MSEPRASLGVGLLALIACCIGLPLIAAAGISVTLSAWVGGIALATVVLITGVAALVLRERRHRNDGPTSILRTRS